ncbi:MAG: hypothetical protein HY043_05950 [Verrucomicrobia bacterium]|nr:hypothetical protein [Verrucomicrobiota bacterium]
MIHRIKKSSWLAVVISGVCLAGLAGGCAKRPTVDPTAVEAASKLPGAADVMAALAKKDYDGAMAALMKVKEAATGEEQTVQFGVLSSQVKSKLLEVADQDQKAADALSVLRAMASGGR